MMTLPRRKRCLWASSSLVPAQCQARLSPKILPLLSQEEGCRRQETMVLRLELSPIDADCTHAITAACVGAAARRCQQRCGRGGPAHRRRTSWPEPPPPAAEPPPRLACQAAGRRSLATGTSQTRAAHRRSTSHGRKTHPLDGGRPTAAPTKQPRGP